MSVHRERGGIRVGTCPDSWGVWYADDPLQPPWPRFLDEAAAAGYSATELGPLGYLPTDPAALLAELDRRRLELTGVMLMGRFHVADAADDLRSRLDRLLAIAAAAGTPHLLLLPDGETPGERVLDARRWRTFLDTIRAVADRAAAAGMRTLLHPHVETPVERAEEIERFLADAEPGVVDLCFDTGHHAYAGGDPVRFVQRHAERMGYLHLKNVDGARLEVVRRDRLDFGAAVRAGVFTLLEDGVIDMAALKRALDQAGWGGWAVVEQDMYPTAFERPFPAARRNLAYLLSLGFRAGTPAGPTAA